MANNGVVEMEALRVEFRGKKVRSIMDRASSRYGKASKVNAYKVVNEAVDDWLTRIPRKKNAIDAGELTGAASGIRMSSLEAGKKALQLFGSAD